MLSAVIILVFFCINIRGDFFLVKHLSILKVCWSPKGKQLASCAKDNRLLIYNHDLEIKSDYKSLTNELKRIFTNHY